MNLRAKLKDRLVIPWMSRQGEDTTGEKATVPARIFGAWPRLGLWLGVRLGFLAVVVYFFQDGIIWLGTLLAIHLVGSWPERVVLVIILGLVLGNCLALLKDRLASRWPDPVTLVLATVLFWLLFQVIPPILPPLPASLFLALILTVNLAPASVFISLWSRRLTRWPAALIFVGGIGLAELLLLRPLSWWLAGRPAAGAERAAQIQPGWYWLPGVFLVSFLAVFLTSAYSLAQWHRVLFPDPAVKIFAWGNFNGLELDLKRRILYTGGYGTNYLLAYDLDALATPPRRSPVENGYAQGFGYNPVEQELYLYNQESRQLLWLDGTTLELKKTIPLPQLSPGDAWVIWDSYSDQLIVASEADAQQGVPFIVINRQSGAIIKMLDIAPGFILPHPTEPLFYMTISFFQAGDDLMVYDMRRQEVALSRTTAGHLDRLAFAMNQGQLELLAPSALEGGIVRFDPETLEPKGIIESLFGARSIAVDPERHLLLSGSLVTHRLEVIDLESQQRLAVYYTGPWLRTLSLDVESGQAYLSTHEGLFQIQYADPLPAGEIDR